MIERTLGLRNILACFQTPAMVLPAFKGDFQTDFSFLGCHFSRNILIELKVNFFVQGKRKIPLSDDIMYEQPLIKSFSGNPVKHFCIAHSTATGA